LNYWLLTTEYPPFYGGGISTYCYHTARMLSEEGHVVTVFINDKTVKSISIENLEEARIIRFNPTLTNSDFFLGNLTKLSFEFANIIKKFIAKEGSPDIIESQDYQGIAYFICQYKRCLFDWCKNIPIVITMHSPSFLYMEYNRLPLYKQPNFWVGEMERFCIQAADLIISPSKYLVNELDKKFTFAKSNLHIIANPYKFNKSEASLAKTVILNNELTFYGKLSAQKGTFKILELFKNMWENGFNKSFTMVGDQNIVFPPLKKTMGTIIQKCYASYIKRGLLKLMPKIDPSQINEFFSNSLIFIIPSTVDNLPYTVLELMGQGKILIVSKQGGQSEVITHEKDGFIFDYNIPGDFTSVLNKVVGLTKEERLSVLTMAIKTIAINYSYHKIYSEKIKVLNHLLKNKVKSPLFPFIRPLNVITNDYIPVIIPNLGKLSVIVPYYNLGKYIDETIHSILESTYKNIEILIINDGSSASNSEKLNKYRNHEVINVIDKPNTGLADTRNFGANMATGEFIAFLDADDKVDATYYEKAIKILVFYKNVHFVGAWTQFFDLSKSIWPTFNPEPPLILTHNTINSSALIYKKQSFLRAGTNDRDFKIGLEDYESVIGMLSKGLNGVAIPELLFYYRVRKGSMIKKSTDKVRADYYNRILLKHKNLFSPFEKEVKELNKNGKPLSLDNSTLDDLLFQQIPIIGVFYKKLHYKVKSNPKLKKTALRIKHFKLK
jgi:glycosyltransferase involved in cell wall biosynthesis